MHAGELLQLMGTDKCADSTIHKTLLDHVHTSYVMTIKQSSTIQILFALHR